MKYVWFLFQQNDPSEHSDHWKAISMDSFNG
jgi:hypothetical protein